MKYPCVRISTYKIIFILESGKTFLSCKLKYVFCHINNNDDIQPHHIILQNNFLTIKIDLDGIY